MARKVTVATLAGQIESLEADTRTQIEALAQATGPTAEIERSLERLAEAMMWARRHVEKAAAR